MNNKSSLLALEFRISICNFKVLFLTLILTLGTEISSSVLIFPVKSLYGGTLLFVATVLPYWYRIKRHATAETKFSNFVIEYLDESETVFENVLKLFVTGSDGVN